MTHFEKRLFFISCPVFDVWRHIAVIMPFSIVFLLNLLFRHLILIFKQYLSWKRFSSMTRETFVKILMQVMHHLWHLTSYSRDCYVFSNLQYWFSSDHFELLCLDNSLAKTKLKSVKRQLRDKTGEKLLDDVICQI